MLSLGEYGGCIEMPASVDVFVFGVTISWIRIYNTLANRWLNDNTQYTTPGCLCNFASVGMNPLLKCSKIWILDDENP